MFGVALLVLGIGYVLVDANAAPVMQVCFDAKVCIHNGIERCGVNSSGRARRFLDACDIKEFNCIKNTDYVKTVPEKCEDLPALEANDYDVQLPEVTKYWCWRAAICSPTKYVRGVCAKDIQMRTRVFKKFMSPCSVFKRNCASKTGFISVLFLVQNNHPVAADEQDDKDEETAYLVSQYYCHRLRSCTSPAQGPVCGYSQANHYLADFADECTMFRANCDSNGRVVFYKIEQEICDMKKKYDEENKNEIFEWERISRVSISTSPIPTPVTQAPPQLMFSQRMKLAV